MYPSFSRWPLLLGLLSLGYLIRFTTGQTCEGPFEVTRPEDVQSLFQNCTHVVGDIAITETYSGPFILPNITTITGGLELLWFLSQHPGRDSSIGPQVTSVELPDLTTIKYVQISNITTLKSISMPRLTTIGWQFAVDQRYLVVDAVDVPLLQEAPTFYLAGSFSSVNVNSLRNASERIDLNGWPPRTNPGEDNPELALDIAFPSLEYTGRLWIDGMVSSLSMPALNTVGEVSPPSIPHSRAGRHDDVLINVDHTPASFDFSGLQNLTDDFGLAGPIKRLNLSSLQSSRAEIRITTSHALSLDLPLQEVDIITLSGAIESVKFPNLKDFYKISVHSTLPVGCANFTRDMHELAQSIELTTVYECSEPHPSSLGLIALLVILVAAIAGAWHLWMKRRSQKADGKRQPKWA